MAALTISHPTIPPDTPSVAGGSRVVLHPREIVETWAAGEVRPGVAGDVVLVGHHQAR